MHLPGTSLGDTRALRRWGGAVVLFVSGCGPFRGRSAGTDRLPESGGGAPCRAGRQLESRCGAPGRDRPAVRGRRRPHASACRSGRGRRTAECGHGIGGSGVRGPAALPPGTQPGNQRQRQSLRASQQGRCQGGELLSEGVRGRDHLHLDPFSRAKIFFSHRGAGAEIAPFKGAGDAGASEEGEGGFEVEEGYVEWVGLPGGLSLKLGKFFQQFGQLNRWHEHALPFQSRSLPHLAFVGDESLAQSGASVHWLVPFGGRSGTYEATVEVTRSGNESLFGEAGDVSVLGHLNAFWDLSSSTDLDLGLSWIGGTYLDYDYAGDRDLYGAEMAFTWRPPGQSRYRGFTLRGGVMALSGLISGVTPGASALADERALGWWSARRVQTLAELVGRRPLRSRRKPQGYQRDDVGHVSHAHLVAERVCPTAPRV